MKYDPDIHEIVDVRHPKIGEQVIAMMGTLITVEGNSVGEPSCSGEWPIVRERVHDLAWAVAEMIRHPMVEYRGPELCHRWNPGGLFEYVFLGEWKPAEYFAKDEIASTEWHRVDAEPQPEPLTPEALTPEALTAEVHTLRDEVRRLREKVEGV